MLWSNFVGQTGPRLSETLATDSRVCEEVVVVENEGGCSIHGRERCWVVKFIPVRPGNVVFDFLIWLFGIGIA